MKWLRAKMKRVTSLALFALAVNLAIGFGHLHLEDLGRAEALRGILLSTISSDRDNDRNPGYPDDVCPICMAQAALGTGLATAAPMPLVDPAYVKFDAIPVAELGILQRPRAAFQSRAPPLS